MDMEDCLKACEEIAKKRGITVEELDREFEESLEKVRREESERTMDCLGYAHHDYLQATGTLSTESWIHILDCKYCERRVRTLLGLPGTEKDKNN
ncbi:MAG: hypothetical protein HZA35_01655 [Parcubacteria group bacterium]|nr:hypothetical protein [Parcubacteria group bacterium]